MRRDNSPLRLILIVALVFGGATHTLALTELSDDTMSGVSGAGLAFPFEDFYFQMAPTSFIELTGSDPTGSTTFIRGDLRYYGLTMSRAVDGSGNRTTTNLINFDGSTCTGGFFGLGCPASSESLINFANFDNPYIWRAFNYEGYTPAGGTKVNDRPVFEILGPSNMDDFRWALMGEAESGREVAAIDPLDPSYTGSGLAPITGASCAAGSGSSCITQFQNLILGKPVSLMAPPSIAGGESASNAYTAPALRFLQYAGTTGSTGSNPSTYGIQYLHRLSGDYRLTVNTSSGSGGRGDMPVFTNEEGLYFKDVEAYLPLGQLHYQALVFDDSQPGSSGSAINNGNITIELTAIPDVSEVYEDFYGYNGGSYTNGYDRVNRTDRYYETHGYSEWGAMFPSCSGGGVNGSVQCLSGSGVSQVRFAGIDPDGPTHVINATFYPGHDNPCSYDDCTYSGQTVGNLYNASSRQEVVAQGGMVFVSRSESSYWQVLHNQNRSQSNIPVMTRVREQEYNCSILGCSAGSDTRGILEANPSYTANNANPLISVNAINLGSSRVLGLQINHMKIETLGGQ